MEDLSYEILDYMLEEDWLALYAAQVNSLQDHTFSFPNDEAALSIKNIVQPAQITWYIRMRSAYSCLRRLSGKRLYNIYCKLQSERGYEGDR
jgi:hypothetical protein